MSAAVAAPGALRLAGELTIYRAEELKRELLAALAITPVLDLTLDEVSECDSAGLQLLLAARAAALASGGALRLHQPSAAVQEVLALTGLAAGFGDGDGA